MSWWNKSNYKKKNDNWWDDPLDDDADGGGYYGEGYNAPYSGGGWNSYDYGRTSWYKPRYDMSYSLETRVRQLIRTVTGKDLRVVQAGGWGNDEKYFYYNPSDLENATDDEVLGRILHQLARELYHDTEATKKLNAEEPDYRHLVNILEDNRADTLLQQRYAGVGYYAGELWYVRKFTDNPIFKYLPQIKPNDLDELNAALTVEGHNKLSKANYVGDTKKDYDQWVEHTNEKRAKEENPSWEFCFNISALQNGEEEWDFKQPKIREDFEKAVPFIKQYLAAPTLEEAQKFYPPIKALYPKPTKEQQQQMDKQMAQTEGLSPEQMEQMREQADRRQAVEEGRRGEKTDKEFESEFGSVDYRDFADDHVDGKFNIDRNMAEYKRLLAENQGTANTLFGLIRSILKDNTIKRFNRPFKRGKLDAKRIYKYVATDNLRIFKRPRVINQKDYLMAIVVDMSGSMRGQNSLYAAKGAIVLADVLERLEFPYEVIAYNGNVYGVKRFDKPLRREVLPSLVNANGDNNEVDTIDILTKHIEGYDAGDGRRKTIFWITDGQSNNPAHVKEKVTLLEKKHNATVYALGIGDVEERFLKESYNTYLMVENVQNLPKELVNLMRAQFRRG